MTRVASDERVCGGGAASGQGPAVDQTAQHFGLSNAEIPIESFSAVNHKLVHGYVTIFQR